MAEQQAGEIVRSDDVKGGVPRIEGTRITVSRIRELVEGAGESPEAVARRLDVSLPAVYRALAYYHENEELFRRLREEEQQLIAEAREAGDLVDAEDLLDENGE
jgi:uncharacterized protein (DUF433 family)